MKTEVIMKRELFGCDIKQKHKSTFFSSTDLIKAGNKWRNANGMKSFEFNQYKNKDATKEFIKELEEKFGTVIISGRGRGKDTWVHPYIFLDIALCINPKLKVEVYDWLFDSLLKYRDMSGDSYKIMCGALYNNTTCKTSFAKDMTKAAEYIKTECGVKNWENANEHQLMLRDKIHEYVSIFCDMFHHNNSQAIRLAVVKAKEYMNQFKINQNESTDNQTAVGIVDSSRD